ncbi:MAG TPA: GntR family transcriptional regulator [Kiloniellales bacterium]|jgi:DNA-binding GntR family transcriptional regulator|nr:GntR family transcriptional regulator [Kiloniellales bacterium]
MGFQTIEPHNLVEQVAEELTRAIVGGRLLPGQRLGEAEIARQMGISRAPVREAARLLEQRGLLVSHPNRGFSVRRPTLEEVDELYGLRLCIERYAAEEMLKRQEDFTHPLRQQYQRLMRAARTQGGSTVVQEDLAFHLLLCELSGNRRLHRLFSDLAGEIHLVIALIGRIMNDPEQLALAHRPLLEAAESRDGARLRKEIDYHITVAWQEVRALFRERLSQAASTGEGPP